MNKSAIIYGILFGLLVAASACRNREVTTFRKLSSAPHIDGEAYNCTDMVSCVNDLRLLGKDGALLALREHIRNNGPTGDPREEKKILLICRLLFLNPKGWKPPGLGVPSPEINWNVADQFPYFPIALSDGVPFLLLSGYFSSGQTLDTGANCVKLCEGFSLIKGNVAETGYVNAAEALIQSDSFRKLYVKSEDMERMSEVIRRQAQGSNRWEKK